MWLPEGSANVFRRKDRWLRSPQEATWEGRTLTLNQGASRFIPLMETGTAYNKERLHGKAYCSELLDEMRRSIFQHATLSVIRRIHSVQLEIRRSTLEKRIANSQTKSGQKTKPTKARGPVQQESKEVMAELVAKLSERLEQKPTQEKAAEGKPQGAPAPNRDRLAVWVDLGDQWSRPSAIGLQRRIANRRMLLNG